MKTTLNR